MDDFESLSDEEVLDQAGLLIDQSADTQDDAPNEQAFALLERLENRTSLLEEHRVLLHYYRANAFENRLRHSGQAQAWSWDIEHLRSVLLELRAAVGNEEWALQ